MIIEHKLQIEAIKGIQLYYAEYGKLIFISDGMIGVYIKESELKINKAIMKKIPEPDFLDPKFLEKERVKAKETDIARRKTGGFCIKLKSRNLDNFCFVNESYLKMFPQYGELYIKSQTAPVYVKKYGNPYGIIMPVHVRNEEE